MEILPIPALFGLLRQFEQRPGLFFRVSRIENGAAGDQQIRSSFDDRGDRIVSHPSVHLDPGSVDAPVPPSSSTSRLILSSEKGMNF